MKRAVELISSNLTHAALTGSYSSSMTMKGSYIISGSDEYGGFLGPKPIIVFRPGEQSTAIPGAAVCVIPRNNRYDYVLLADNATAAVTRRIMLYTIDKDLWEMNWNGFITVNHSLIAGAKTIRGLRGNIYEHTTGTVAVSGATVTGTSTLFQTERISTGARIGFGSTNPTDITTWYDIATISSNTSLTISGDVTLSAGTSYVIEEMQVVIANTNATLANGGLFTVKGLNPSTFSSIGTTITEATTDLMRGVYFHTTGVAPAAQVANGLAIYDSSSYLSHQCYLMTGTTTAQIYSYNLRAPLTVTAAKSTGSFNWATAPSTTLTGTINQLNNSRNALPSHGPGSGSNDLYFATTTRVYRIPSSSIYSGSSVFIGSGDSMTENPPGGTSTAQLTSLQASIEYSSALDAFLIPTTYKTYITQYKTDGSQYDTSIGSNTLAIDPVSTPLDSIPHVNNSNSQFSVWVEDGLLYMVRNTATVTVNQGYVVPLLCDYRFALNTNQYIITQALNTSSATKLYRAYVLRPSMYGNQEYGTPPSPLIVEYRTSGISDNSGAWAILSQSGDLTGAAPGEQIQFRIRFKITGYTGVPSKFYGICVVYEDDSSVANYIPSVSNSSSTNRIFAWRLNEAFVTSVPNLDITLKNADTNSVVLSDDITNQSSGTFEYSTDGTAWSAWNATAANVVNRYIRYTATTLPDNISIYASLTLA